MRAVPTTGAAETERPSDYVLPAALALLAVSIGLAAAGATACDRPGRSAQRSADAGMSDQRFVEIARELAVRRWREQVPGWADENHGWPRCLQQPPQITRTDRGVRVVFEHAMNAPAGGTRIYSRA